MSVYETFLDSKTLFYDTDIFLFYVMTVRTDVLDEEMNASLRRRGGPAVEPVCNLRYPTGETIVGYFSKEKCENNILACILTFPCFHRMGIGSLLIDFAYLLGQMENRQAGPEEPLSKLGLLGFTAYWSNKVLEYLLQYTFGINLEELLQVRRNGSMATLSSESVPVSLDAQSESSMHTLGTEKELTFSPCLPVAELLKMQSFQRSLSTLILFTFVSRLAYLKSTPWLGYKSYLISGFATQIHSTSPIPIWRSCYSIT